MIRQEKKYILQNNNEKLKLLNFYLKMDLKIYTKIELTFLFILIIRI